MTVSEQLLHLKTLSFVTLFLRCCWSVFTEGGRRHPFLFFPTRIFYLKGLLLLVLFLHPTYTIASLLAFKFPPEFRRVPVLLGVSAEYWQLCAWERDGGGQNRWSLHRRCYGPIVNGCISRRTDGFGSGLSSHFSQLGIVHRFGKLCGCTRVKFGDPAKFGAKQKWS